MKLLSLVTTALLLAGVSPAQTFTVIHTFTGNVGYAETTMALGGNTLYGTTFGGGALFKVRTDGTGFGVVHSPSSGDWINPNEVILSGNTLYGTTQLGGDSALNYPGTIFKVDTDGSNYTVLRTFTNSSTDGYRPSSGLIIDGTTLYGTTSGAGSGGSGTVFKINTDASGFTVLYSFTDWHSNNVDGCFPYGGLVLAGSALFGTTMNGGSDWSGTIFKLNTDGSGFAVLHSFSRIYSKTNADGGYTEAALIVSGDTLYGTTTSGGFGGMGTAFKVSTNGTGFAVLHQFEGPPADALGYGPRSALVLRGNTLYGTAPNDGFPGWLTRGSVFKVNTDGTCFERLHIFSPGQFPGNTNEDGGLPYGGLVMSGATLYGTSAFRGPAGNGTIFSLELAPQPIISSLFKTNGMFTFCWNANPGSTYQVQYSSDAASTPWSNLNGVIVATNTTLSVVDLIGTNTQRFYRVVLLFP